MYTFTRKVIVGLDKIFLSLVKRSQSGDFHRIYHLIPFNKINSSVQLCKFSLNSESIIRQYQQDEQLHIVSRSSIKQTNKQKQK
jgi:hypothetical protein